MSTPAILRKLTAELEKGVTTEVQVVYLLAGIRKLIERDERGVDYAALNFHCDWALHAHLDRAGARAILKQFDAAHALLKGQVALHDLPTGLRREIDRISKMTSFREQLPPFLDEYGLPPLTLHRPDAWAHFLHLYARVIEDIPLVVKTKLPKEGEPDSSPNISRVMVQFEAALKPVEHAGRQNTLYKVRWLIYDRNDQQGEIFVINSFELDTASQPKDTSNGKTGVKQAAG